MDCGKGRPGESRQGQEGTRPGLPCGSDGAAQGQEARGRPFKAWLLCHCPRSLEFLSDVTFASYHLIHFSSCLWEIGSGLGRALCVCNWGLGGHPQEALALSRPPRDVSCILKGRQGLYVSLDPSPAGELTPCRVSLLAPGPTQTPAAPSCRRCPLSAVSLGPLGPLQCVGTAPCRPGRGAGLWHVPLSSVSPLQPCKHIKPVLGSCKAGSHLQERLESRVSGLCSRQRGV